MGIAANMLYRWKGLHEQQIQGNVLVEDEREELKRLRKENKELRRQKEILKKASVDSSAFFAKEIKFGFIKTQAACYPVRILCRVM